MAKEFVVVLKAEDKASGTINKVKGEVTDVGKEAANTTSGLTSQLDKVSGGAVSMFRSMVGGIKSAVLGFKTLKGAIIGTGIGALIVAVTSLTAAFTSSEEGQNKLAKIMGVIGVLTGNLVDLLADLGEKLIWAFENPKQSINDFVKLLKENIVNRFEGLLELIPKLGDAITLLFQGEFTAAGQVAANAVGKVALGVENITEKLGEAIEKVKEFGAEQLKEANQAVKVADMRAKADKLERDLLVKRSKLESEIAELRLKARQEDQFSADERKAALIEAQKLENELLDRETEVLSLKRDAQVLENTFSRTNKENLDKEAEAIAAVNRQVAARANTARQLQRELNTINGQLEAEENARRQQRLQEEKEFQDQFNQLQKDAEEIDKQARERKKIQTEQEKADAQILASTKIELNQAVANSLVGLTNLAADGSRTQKALALAEIAYSTGSSIAAAIRNAQSPTPDNIATGGLAGIAKGIALTAQIISSVARAKSILNKAPSIPKLQGGSVSGGGSGSSFGGGGGGGFPSFATLNTTSALPQFNGQATLPTGTTNGKTKEQPIRAFIVNSDISNSQNASKNLAQKAIL